MLKTPFRYRSGCHLELVSLKHGERDAELDVNIKAAVNRAAFRAEGDQAPIITDIYWPHDELYREGSDDDKPSFPDGGENDPEDGDSEGA
ncbi:MAG: hypothetical protein ACREE9_23120 [Stellaceae bacterium]